MTLHDIQKKLRHANIKNYILYLFCNFMGLMLITAFSTIMFSPTVMDVLPPGGDSRKQVYAVFALTCVGCLVFTIYAASLFFRMKSREMGIFMALGASRRRLMPSMVHETVYLSGISALLGMVMGVPFAMGLWNLFRFTLANTPEMVLRLDFRCLIVSVLFLLLVMGSAALTGWRHLKNSHIMDVIHEEHQNEAVKVPKKWCGPVGIFLIVGGAVLGYYSELIYRALFQAYGPAWLSITYAPVFLGLYMVVLHTVVHGWGSRRDPYKGMIARSMMKFQGKQTVNNMLVVTVLIAGGCFGLFYIPISYTSSVMGTDSKNYDYSYCYPAYVDAPGEDAVEELAADAQITLQDWNTVPYAILATDGTARVDDEGNKFHDEYWKLFYSVKFLSETNYRTVTGEDAKVPEGAYKIIWNDEESSYLPTGEDVSLLTNMVTGKTHTVAFQGMLHYNQLTGMTGYCVLDDGDYEAISRGLDEQWTGAFTCFNVDGEDSYSFAKDLYHIYVDSMEAADVPTNAYDPVYMAGAREAGISVEEEFNWLEPLPYEEQDTYTFRMYWDYFPQFRIMDEMDTMKNFAVFFMVFLFIVIVCYLAALIICYTRSMTIAINNRYVFEDLEKLGASQAFLKKEIRRQSSKIFTVPSIVGMGSMSLLYALILYANDNKITSNEVAGMLACGAMQMVIAFIIYLVYRKTARKMDGMLIKR